MPIIPVTATSQKLSFCKQLTCQNVSLTSPIEGSTKCREDFIYSLFFPSEKSFHVLPHSSLLPHGNSFCFCLCEESCIRMKGPPTKFQEVVEKLVTALTLLFRCSFCSRLDTKLPSPFLKWTERNSSQRTSCLGGMSYFCR